jgi:hypothetical protein
MFCSVVTALLEGDLLPGTRHAGTPLELNSDSLVNVALTRYDCTSIDSFCTQACLTSRAMGMQVADNLHMARFRHEVSMALLQQTPQTTCPRCVAIVSQLCYTSSAEVCRALHCITHICKMSLGQQPESQVSLVVMSHANLRSSRVLLVGYPADEVVGEGGTTAWGYHPPPLIKRVLTDPSSPAGDSFIHLADPQPPGSLGE